MYTVCVSSRVFDRYFDLLTVYSAEVIKIEHPIRGDDTRAWGPPYATYTEKSGKQGSGESAYFLAVRLGISKLTNLHHLTWNR